MKNLKFVRNLIISAIGIFIAFFVLSLVKEDSDIVHTDNVVSENQNDTKPSKNDVGEFVLTSPKGVDIFITEPQIDSLSKSPIKISGRAPGNWFFEANMPVTLKNTDGTVITKWYVMATGDWMTTEYVPFEGQIEFTKLENGEKKAILVLAKDNPSDKRELDDSVEMIIRLD